MEKLFSLIKSIFKKEDFKPLKSFTQKSDIDLFYSLNKREFDRLINDLYYSYPFHETGKLSGVIYLTDYKLDVAIKCIVKNKDKIRIITTNGLEDSFYYLKNPLIHSLSYTGMLHEKDSLKRNVLLSIKKLNLISEWKTK